MQSPGHTMEPDGEDRFVVRVDGDLAGYVTQDPVRPGLWIAEDQKRRFMGRVYQPEKAATFLAAWFIAGDEA
ncbi:protein of unknown function [Methylorubrum extorquens]|uniref:Uncharacterized protein n=1 Tax=Methylorubrum extorquens TaxID=408 RepID=A0A2N9AM80_METEX|nr:hypothetical protein B2G69_06565 [Methylorubrum zatmanii]KQQ04676.1 hypothetical protein ASF59_02735 [Methylobacterium sp. Leaf121]SOR28467.1 protein of unknown function [Methylorubrum extorquens]